MSASHRAPRRDRGEGFSAACFPGFISPKHTERALDLCWLGADHA